MAFRVFLSSKKWISFRHPYIGSLLSGTLFAHETWLVVRMAGQPSMGPIESPVSKLRKLGNR
jgi:hypothetical protein